MRIPLDEYALRLAETAALRSEDPWRRVGACALSHDHRVIALAYNGVAQGVDPDPSFWLKRDERLPFMIHAEQNLCALFKRGDAALVAVTTQPCPGCLNLLVAHGVSEVVYREPYDRDGKSTEIAKFHNIVLRQIKPPTTGVQPEHITYL
jgi:dCMP deaminase